MLGKVKTRLARTIGDEEALSVYDTLCELTRLAVAPVDCIKYLYYSDFVVKHDHWPEPPYFKKIQEGKDLGQRMANAFSALFSLHNSIILIGSDCPYLHEGHIQEAFEHLKHVDCVLGPASDGGYYLIGLSAMIPELFINKSWSRDTLLNESLDTLTQLNKSVYLLTELSDIDNHTDWEDYCNS